MKKYLLGILLFGMSNCLFAQGLRVNLYGSYVFDDHFETYADTYNYYHGTIEGGFQWGAGLEFSRHPLHSFELLYYRQDTQAPTTWQSGQLVDVSFESLNVDLNYIMLAGNRHLIKSDGKIETYAGLLAGVAIIGIENESTRNSESLTKFAWGLRLGVNVWASENVAVKLQAQLLSAVQAAGGGAYIGTGGTGVGVSTYSTMYQFGLGGGLAFKMGKRSGQ